MGWRASCECELAKARLANRGLLAAQVAAHRMQYFRRSMRGSYRSQVEKCQMFFPPLTHSNTTSSASASARSQQTNPGICPFAPFRNRREGQFSARHRKELKCWGNWGVAWSYFVTPAQICIRWRRTGALAHTASHPMHPRRPTHSSTTPPYPCCLSPWLVGPPQCRTPCQHTTLHHVRSNV